MIPIDKETLIDLYINQNLSTRAIGEKLGCGKTKVRKSLDFHNIKKDETTLIESAKQRRANTCQERYGTNNVFEREETQQKARKTLIDKYGGLGYQVEELKKKGEGTFNESYSKEQQEEMKNQRIENIKKAYSTGEPQKKILDHCKTGIPEKKRKETCNKKYGVSNPSSSPEIKEKVKKTNIERFGVDNPTKNKEIQEKIKQTNMERYGVEYVSQNPIIKSKQVEKAKATFATGIPQAKAHETKKAHHTYGYSSAEERAYNKLVEIFGKEDIERQYRSDLYPFPCDLYIKSLDTYIELNCYFTHGPEPYNPKNPKHQDLLETWKRKSQEINFKGETKDQFLYAIKKWTQRDPLKRQTAKKNKLNFFEFFNESDFDDWLNSL